jgi:hypothetical protein
LFAQDSRLFEERLFEKFLKQAKREPGRAKELLRGLFKTMAHGGIYGLDKVDWFNGSLFTSDVVLPLTSDDLVIIEKAASLNWSAIEPAIFGTLFERGIDPGKRSQLGMHYTDPAMIERIIQAVIARPLLAEWAEVREAITQRLAAPTEAGAALARPRRVSVPTLFESLPVSEPAAVRQRVRRQQTTAATEVPAIESDARMKEAGILAPRTLLLAKQARLHLRRG